MAERSALEEWATWAFSPTISTLLVTLFVALSLPLLLHYYLYRKAAAKEAPAFLLVGASGSGKTSLLTLLSNGTPSPTHTSSTPTSAFCTLPSDTTSSSDKYRSVNDTSSRDQPSFLLLDTPGHGKLRHHALSSLSSPTALKGLIFVVDSAASSLTETAEYLHDVLLVLQKRHTQSKTSRGEGSFSVLIAANKQDVFSALPVKMVQRQLEGEIGRVRVTRSKGLLDSGVGMDMDGGAAGGGEQEDEAANWLGEYGSREFELGQLAECGVDVVVKGGSVRGEGGEEGARVGDWWSWIGENL